ncbi:MAG: hypothetical protein JWM27_639 [Gemmatimonadetes bacterium]|nr:hypothetical protein [Gemmatimonadota bacterium]
MARRSGGCLSLLVVLVALGAAGWYFRDRIPFPWKSRHEDPVEVSEAAAKSAEDKISRLRTEHDTVHLNAVELTSLLRYRVQDQLADGALQQPEVRLNGDTLRLTARLPVDRLPDVPELRRVRGFLPDTADVDVRGRVRTVTRGRAALEVTRATFAKFPIPREWQGQLLTRLGRKDQPGLGAQEFPIKLPPGVAAASVQNGELVLSPRS